MEAVNDLEKEVSRLAREVDVLLQNGETLLEDVTRLRERNEILEGEQARAEEIRSASVREVLAAREEAGRLRKEVDKLTQKVDELSAERDKLRAEKNLILQRERLGKGALEQAMKRMRQKFSEEKAQIQETFAAAMTNVGDQHEKLTAPQENPEAPQN